MKKSGSKTSPVPDLKPLKPAKPGNLWVYGLIVFFFGLALYGNTYKNKYSLDDHLVTYPNEQIAQGLKAIPDILTTRYAQEEQLSYGYRPLVKITYAVEYAIWGFKPGRSHFFNALFYALTGLLLFHLLKKLFKNHHPAFPFIITLLFLAHPVHTEVVASLKNRDELLGFLFNLLTLLMILRFVETRRIRFLLLSVLMFILVLLSKPTAAIFFIIYPLALYFFTDVKARPLLYSALSFLGLVMLFLVFTRFILPENVRPVQYYENPLFFEKNIWLRIGTGFSILIFYLRMLLFPHPLRFYYGYDMIPVVNLADIWVILSILIHLGLLFYAIYTFRKKHILSFAILYYLLMMAMYSNFILPSPGIVAERYLYVSSLGFSIALAYLIFKAFRTNPERLNPSSVSLAGILATCLVILIPYSVHTFNRNKDWKNYLTLYESDIPYLERSVKANMLYASLLTREVTETMDMDQQAKWVELIKRHYDQALKIHPDNFEILNNYGSFYAYTLGEPDRALPYLVKATRLQPERPEPYFNLGYTYKMKGDTVKAIASLRTASRLDPSNVNIKSELANLYFDADSLVEAIGLNEEIIQTNPTLPLPYVNLGNYQASRGDTVRAIPYWEKAVALQPEYRLCMMISWYYLHQLDSARTWQYYNMAQRVKPKMIREEVKR
ncbi:MAG TPA: tetratricopeptide repeat protein [Bacteroidales bacterium]|nr:tetratricopeptide repeat protein [Bacteroidales bacterium]HNS47267.1 tetratricopeptide repeat protein [Bacteroidales bacterium]